MNKIPVFEPNVTKKQIKYVIDTLKRNEISGSFGKYIDLFEKKFANYIGTKYAVSVSNGTNALQIAIDILNFNKGSEIIISSCTNIATALAVVKNGHIPIPINSNINSWNLDIDLIEKNITKKTRAIIVVHFLGNPVNFVKLNKIKKKYNLVIIEDAAEAHGAKINNKMVGNLGDISCFSFYSNKVITSGEGGMVCTNIKSYEKKIRLYKNLGFTKPRFKHFILGYNFRLSAMQAALGLGQLEDIEKIIKKKIWIAETYKKYLNNSKGVLFLENQIKSRNVFWQFGIRITKKFPISKKQLVKYLLDKGVETRSFFMSLRNQPCLKKYIPTKVKKTPISDILWNEGLYLPSSHNLTKNKIKKICNLLNNLYEKKNRNFSKR